MKNSSLWLALVSAAAFSANAATSTLDFSSLVLADYDEIPDTYGDALGNTPNVQVDYFSSSLEVGHLLFWNTGYGDLNKVAFAASNGSYGSISLVPDPGYKVTLYSFDIAGWPASNIEGSVEVSLNDQNFLLSNLILGSGPSHSHFDGLWTSDGPVTIEWGTSWNIGIDNIVFGQELIGDETPVPEVSSVAIFGSALAAMFLSRRRKK